MLATVLTELRRRVRLTVTVGADSTSQTVEQEILLVNIAGIQMRVDADHISVIPSVSDHHFPVSELLHVLGCRGVSESVWVDVTSEASVSDSPNDLVDALILQRLSSFAEPEFGFRVVPSRVQTEVCDQVRSRLEQAGSSLPGLAVEVDDWRVLVELHVLDSHVENFPTPSPGLNQNFHHEAVADGAAASEYGFYVAFRVHHNSRFGVLW